MVCEEPKCVGNVGYPWCGTVRDSSKSQLTKWRTVHDFMKTYYSDKVDEAETNGFQTIFRQSFRGHFERDEEYRILAHYKFGLLLTLESYQWNVLNRAELYFNWQAKDWTSRYRPKGSGHIWSKTPMASLDTSDWAWVGHNSLLDNDLKGTIKLARKYGRYLPIWKDSAALNFHNYTERSSINRYPTVTDTSWAKINQFPKWAKDIFMTAIIRNRLTTGI